MVTNDHWPIRGNEFPQAAQCTAVRVLGSQSARRFDARYPEDRHTGHLGLDPLCRCGIRSCRCAGSATAGARIRTPRSWILWISQPLVQMIFSRETEGLTGRVPLSKQRCRRLLRAGDLGGYSNKGGSGGAGLSDGLVLRHYPVGLFACLLDRLRMIPCVISPSVIPLGKELSWEKSPSSPTISRVTWST